METNEAKWVVDVDADTEFWLGRETPAGARALALWKANAPCIERANAYAAHVSQADGVLYRWANVDALYLAALGYMAQLGLAVDHCIAALASHDPGSVPSRRVEEKKRRLERLAADAEPIHAAIEALWRELDTQRRAS